MSAAHVSGVYEQKISRASRGFRLFRGEYTPLRHQNTSTTTLGEKTYLSRGNFFVQQRVQLLVLSSIGLRSVVWQRSKGFFQLLLERRRVLART